VTRIFDVFKNNNRTVVKRNLKSALWRANSEFENQINGEDSLNILITGGCGFIGVNLARVLVKNQNNVRVLDNLSIGLREDLAQVGPFQESVLGKPGIKTDKLALLVGDIRNAAHMQFASNGVDAVIHLAANTGVISSIKDPESDFEANVIGTFNCLESARLNGVRRVVFASSGASLGEQVPPIHEDMAPHPISPYGASKLCGEAYCSAYWGAFGIETVALRFGNVYGPYSRHKNSVVAKFIKHLLASEPLPIYGDGSQKRDLIFVEDLVDAIMLALGKPGIGGQVFQITAHCEHSVFELAEELNCLAQKYLGRGSPIIYEKERKGEVRRNLSDISKARRMLGFEPKHDLKTGLEKTFLSFLKDSNKHWRKE
jgi:UDP-glucose 4-epimerase